MLHSTSELEHYRIAASDGVFARVQDFYFDDESWVIRYLVVDTGDSPGVRSVLMSPRAISAADPSAKLFRVASTQGEIRRNADIDAIKPVSRQHEMGYFGYDEHGQPVGGGGLWGAGFYPDVLRPGAAATLGPRGTPAPNLRSLNAVARYFVHASDGDIGHVGGFLIDDGTWAIRYVVVNTSNWWIGHEVIMAPESIDDVDWAACIVTVDLTRQAVKDSPRPTETLCSNT